MNLPIHPLAEAFPLISGNAFDELTESIKKDGLHEPIVLLDGAILDGRNRHMACLKAGIEPRFVEFNGGDPEIFVIIKNLHRRQLTPGQKAMLVQKFCKQRKNGYPPADMDASMSVVGMAKMAGIHQDTLSDAKLIANRGTSEQIEAVKDGSAGVAHIAECIRKGLTWERPKKREKQPSTRRSEYARDLAKFEKAIHFVADTCEHSAALNVPATLTAEQIKMAEKDLAKAVSNLNALRRRLGGRNG